MSTSLAEQLQRLSVPQTSVYTRDKKRPSLIFDPKEAAGLKREVIYHIGLEGLQELISKNEAFATFQYTLFHITSKNFERSTVTAEDNEKLSKNIKKFLFLLSPYFLLNCTRKALEWLVNRYSIQEYNRNDLLMLALPYHESNFFVRVIQIMKFEDNESFCFLKPLQKSGVYLPKLSLLNHASSSCAFINDVSRYILQLISEHANPNILTVAFNFYSSVFLGMIEYSHNISEEQISMMLPSILKGLNSTIADFCAASYVVTARLVTKTTISQKLLEKFVDKISELKVQGLKTEGILLLVVIYQSHDQSVNISPRAVVSLAEKQWLPDILQDLSNSGAYILPFFEKLLCTGIYEGAHKNLKVVQEMVTECFDKIMLQPTFVAAVINCVLETIKSKSKLPEEVKNWLSEIIQTMERQYPDQFDKEVCHILSSSSTEDKVRNRKKRALSKILSNTETYRGKIDILQKLYHANPQIREVAIKYLSDNYQLLRDSEKEFVKNSFIDRLNDDDVNIVKDTLAVLLKSNVVELKSLKKVLIDLATKCRKNCEKWDSITRNVLQVLCKNFENDWDVFLAVIPFLLPVSPKGLILAKKLIVLPLVVNSTIFKASIKKLLKAPDATSFERIVVKALQANTSIGNVMELLEVKNILEDVYYRYVSFFTITSMLPKESLLDVGTAMLEMYSIHLEGLSECSEEDNTPAGYIEIAARGMFPVKGYLICLQNINKKINVPDGCLHLKDFSESERGNRYFLLATNILMRNSTMHRKLLNEFLDYFFSDCTDKYIFLLNLCICNNSILHAKFKYIAISYIKEDLVNLSEEIGELMKESQLFIPFLLVTLLDTDNVLRKIVFDVFKQLKKKSSIESGPYYILLESILKYKDEVVIDQEQTALVLYNILSSSGGKYSLEFRLCIEHLVTVGCDEKSPLYLTSGILKLLSMVNTTEILEKFASFGLNILKDSLDGVTSFKANVLVNIINKIDSDIIEGLRFDSDTWKFIEICTKSDKTSVCQDGNSIVCLSSLMLNALDKKVFETLNPVIAKRLLDIIIEVACLAQHPEISPTVNRIFKHIDLDSSWILDHLVSMRDVQPPRTGGTPKRRRPVSIPTVDILETLEWRKGVTVLEFIQDKKKIRGFDILLSVLFDLLKRCLDFDEQTAVEYPKQLLLAAILNCCQRSEVELPETSFNVELIVQCIRASQNPQTHHFALLLLAHTAHFTPNQVLLHMMAIFTFMGSSVLRHDDSYSFQVISKIIDTIIPILVQDNNTERISGVLRVFVDAILDVPEHRRSPLYKQMLEKIDAQENLHIFLLVVFEAQVLRNAKEKRSDSAQKRLEITSDLCRKFGPRVVIGACIKLIKYLRDLPDEKDENAMQINKNTTDFAVIVRTPKDFRHFKYVLLKFTSNLLSSQEFVIQVASLRKEEELQLEDMFKDMIVNVLQYIQRISKIAEKAANSPQAQYWKVVLHLSYDILDSVNFIVTSQMFLLITKGLMVHNLNTIKRRVLELLNTKLQSNIQFFEECDKNEIYSLIPPLVSIVESLDGEVDPEKETIVQTALLSLKLLVKSLASKDPEKCVPLLQFISRIVQSGKTHSNVLASVLLCLAELCINLKAYAISSLPNFMPAVIKILKKCRREEIPSVLLRSVITTVEKIFDSMPLFLSPYLEKLLTEICQLTAKWNITIEEQKIQSFVGKIATIKQKIGSVVPPRILLPALANCYEKLSQSKCYKGIGALMTVLGENVGHLQSSEVTAVLPELTSFFLNVLKFRDEKEVSIDEANEVEAHVVKALTVLTMKLSESTFRPFYYKLYDWAVRRETNSERIITFYRLSSGIAHSLKSLFVLFAGHFIKNAAEVIDSCNLTKNRQLYFDDEKKNILLLESVLDTLDAVFTYDNQHFINKDRFQILMQPLVDQLENTLGGLDSLLERNERLLTPCLVHFAFATADDALWKTANYQLLLKIRSAEPKVRLIALHCLTETVKRLGEDFLPLLPETVPFLVELLEDEEESVEGACQTAVREMEAVLGEPLQKYF